MRIFFIGTVKFSYDALVALIASGAELVGVATKEDSQINADYADLKPICQQHGIPYKIVRDINHINNISFIQDLAPDVIYCFGWSNLLKKELLSTAPKGVIGFHPAALPFNKGRHPIIWALCLDLKTTASSFFFMDEGADTGDLISQESVSISQEDDAATLYKKITNTAINQILTFTPALKAGTNARIQQVETGNAWRKRSRKDGEIDFRMSSKSIYNLVRALTKPYVGAHVSINGEEFKVWKTEILEFNIDNLEPGQVLYSDEQTIKVKTGDGAILLTDHQIKEIPLVGSYL